VAAILDWRPVTGQKSFYNKSSDNIVNLPNKKVTVTNDNRINPRVPLSVPVNITLPDKHEVQIQSENISLTGLMIVATQVEFEALLHRRSSEGINVQPELHAQFVMSRKTAKDVTVKAECRAIHVRRVSQNKYYVGLKFLQLNQAAASAIQQHVQSNLY